MAGICNTHEINEELYSENLKESASLGDLAVDGINIFK
jgi:hypothetical protein